MDTETERYIYKGSPQTQIHKQMVPPILERPASNGVVTFTNILNLLAIKFHIPSIWFLKGSASSAARRKHSDGFTGGGRPARCRKLGCPPLVVTPANLVSHVWIKWSIFPIRDCRDLKTGEHCRPAQEIRHCLAAHLRPLLYPKTVSKSIDSKLIYSLIRRYRPRRLGI